MHGRDDDDACHCKDRECDGSICIHLLLFSPAAPTLAGPPYDDDDCAFFAQLFWSSLVISLTVKDEDYSVYFAHN